MIYLRHLARNLSFLLKCQEKISVTTHHRAGRDSSVSIATRYGLDDTGTESRWGGGRFFTPVRAGPEAHPASCIMGTRSFPGVKRLWCGSDHPPPTSAEVEGRVELYLYSRSGPLWPVIEWNLAFTFTHHGIPSLKINHQLLVQDHDTISERY